MRFLVADPFCVFCLSRTPIWRMFSVISSYLMSQVLFSSLQFWFAQCYTWVVKKIAKHEKIAKYILYCIGAVKRWVHEVINSSKMSHLMTKPIKWSVCPVKTPISRSLCPVWSVFTLHSVGSWGPNVSSCGQQRLIRPDAQADQSLCWVHVILLVLMWGSSNCKDLKVDEGV